MYLSVVTIHTSYESTGSHPHPSCVKLCERISLSNNSFDSALLCTDTPAIKIRHAPIHAALKDTAQLMHLELWSGVVTCCLSQNSVNFRKPQEHVRVYFKLRSKKEMRY